MAKSTYAPELYSIEDVLSFFDAADGCNYYEMYIGHEQDPAKFRGKEYFDDPGAGRHKLEQALIANKQNADNVNPYSIFLYSLNGKKKELLMATTFQLNKRQNLYPYNPQPFSNSSELADLKAELIALKMKMAEPEDYEDDEPEDDNILGQVLKNDQFKQILMMGISNLFFPKQNVQGLAGIPGSVPEKQNEKQYSQDDKIDIALEILGKHDDTLGDDLMLLAQMAENDPGQFKFLLNLLRK
jgi:hypothetical protein